MVAQTTAMMNRMDSADRPVEARPADRLRAFEDIIRWALGEGESDFPSLPDDWPKRKFYWRTMLQEKLDAALSLAVPAPGWQPIETAPEDGAEVLLTDGHYKRTGFWARRVGVWSMDAAVALAMPTHWMPLPPAPPEEPK